MDQSIQTDLPVQDHSNEFLMNAAEGGDVKILEYLINNLHLDLSKCICGCLIRAYEKKHPEMLGYLMNYLVYLYTQSMSVEDVRPFLQTAISSKNIYLVCWILNVTKMKPVTHDIELAIKTQDIDVLKFLTQEGYEEEYYSNRVRRAIEHSNQPDFEEIVTKEVIPCEFSRVSADDNTLLKTCLAQDCNKMINCIKGIMTHRRFVLTPSLRDILVKFIKEHPEYGADGIELIRNTILSFENKESK